MLRGAIARITIEISNQLIKYLISAKGLLKVKGVLVVLRKLEVQSREGYRNHPVASDEFGLWQKEQAWTWRNNSLIHLR